MSVPAIDASNPLFRYDMDKLCAICLKRIEGQKLYTLADQIPNSNPLTLVSDVIKSISKFSAENGPEAVCVVCFNNVRAAYKFQKMCNRAQEYIQNFTEHQRKMEERLSTETVASGYIEAIKTESPATNPEENHIEDQKQAGPFSYNAKRLKCKVCLKMYRADYISAHMRTHTGERPYQCQICKNSYAQPTTLTKHMLFHSNKRDYVCNYCGQAFHLSGSLRSHMRIHTDERPFPCTYCEKSFRTHSERKNHLRVHTGEKPYQCEVCAKAFSRSSHLSLHTKIHTNDKRHICSVCGKAFIQAHSLRSHLQTHAKKEAVNVETPFDEIPNLVEVEYFN